MLRQLIGNCQILVVQLIFDVRHRRAQKLANGLRDNSAHIGVSFKLIGVIAQILRERRQIEVPVFHGTHLRRGARKRGHRLKQVLRLILMPQVALIRVTLLGLAALNRAKANNLTAVQERFCLRIVELQRRGLLQPAVLVELR